MKDIAFAVPGDLATPTGGYAYDRHIIAELAALGWRVEVVDLGEGFPRPSAQTLAAAGMRLTGLAKGRPLVIDGLAFGTMPELAADLSHSRPLIALVHHPLALESGLSAQDAEFFHRRECAALACTEHVVVTSPSTARLLAADFGVAPGCVTVVPPGCERCALARGSSDGIVRLLAVGSVVPRKGYDVLVAALATLKDLPWRLTIVGDRTRDSAAALRLDADIRHHGLDERINVAGAIAETRLAEFYVGADLFVLASRFEGYGMAFAEAIAHGLPVVGTTAGAIPETVPSGAGVLLPPDDAAALAATLRRLIGHAAELAALAAGARSAAATFPTWQESGRLFAMALEQAA